MGAGFTIWPLLLFMVVGSIAVAVWPLRSTRVRVVVLSIHLIASLVLIMVLEGPRPMWVIVLGPGLLIAATRLVLVAVRSLRSWV